MTGLPIPSPLVLRDRIVSELARRLPAVRSVKAHGGAFDLDEVKRFALDAPAIRVALLGMGAVTRFGTGEMIGPLNFAAVCVTKDAATPGVGVVSRDAACAALAAQALLVVDANRWGWGAELGHSGLVGAPVELSAEALYSGEIDKQGIALWQVTWTQALRIGASREAVIGALNALVVNGEAFVDGADPVAHPAPPAETAP